jgi:hypothetical protein
VNIDTTPGALDALFTSRQVSGAWEAAVRPEYYGLMMFAQAAPPSSRLLSLSGATGDTLRDWATLAPDGQTRVVLINTDPGRARRVYVRVARASGSAGLEWRDAPSVHATTGVTLGGQRFGAETTTGRLADPPRTTSMTAVDGHYAVTLPPGSAALLTLPKPSRSRSRSRSRRRRRCSGERLAEVRDRDQVSAAQASAWRRSATRSLGSSIPQLSRTRSAGTAACDPSTD